MSRINNRKKTGGTGTLGTLGTYRFVAAKSRNNRTYFGHFLVRNPRNPWQMITVRDRTAILNKMRENPTSKEKAAQIEDAKVLRLKQSLQELYLKAIRIREFNPSEKIQGRGLSYTETDGFKLSIIKSRGLRIRLRDGIYEEIPKEEQEVRFQVNPYVRTYTRKSKSPEQSAIPYYNPHTDCAHSDRHGREIADIANKKVIRESLSTLERHKYSTMCSRKDKEDFLRMKLAELKKFHTPRKYHTSTTHQYRHEPPGETTKYEKPYKQTIRNHLRKLKDLESKRQNTNNTYSRSTQHTKHTQGNTEIRQIPESERQSRKESYSRSMQIPESERQSRNKSNSKSRRHIQRNTESRRIPESMEDMPQNNIQRWLKNTWLGHVLKNIPPFLKFGFKGGKKRLPKKTLGKKRLPKKTLEKKRLPKKTLEKKRIPKKL
jgi:hypothetical protein